MCGIIGAIGLNNINKVLINGLKQEEYRGYDSAGIAININNNLTTFKTIGRISKLESILPNIETSLGIGHTRWATHGKVNLQNCHPHFSSSKQICLVHNGTIDNYQEIKATFDLNVTFASETDTEVIATYIEYQLKYHSLIEILPSLKNIFRGSYALLIINQKELNRIYFIKHQTPLIIGKCKKGYVASSDLIAFPEEVFEYHILKDDEYGYIETDKCLIYPSKKCSWNPYIHSIEDTYLGGYESYMEKEIHQQPAILKELIKKYINKEGKVNLNDKTLERINESSKIVFVGCGSSYYASMIGKYFIEHLYNKPVEVILASEAVYDYPTYNKHSFYFIVSQSGETLDVINFVKKYKIKNSIIFTNNTLSTLSLLNKNVWDLSSGKEISVASTKAFFSQCISFYFIAHALANKKIILNKLDKLIHSLQEILNNKSPIEKLSYEISKYHDVFYLGKGIDYLISLEGALKLKEISYIHAEAFPNGELKHGTLALISSESSIIALSSQKDSISSLKISLEECSSRGGNIYLISPKDFYQKQDIKYENIDKYLNVFNSLIILQLIAFFTCKQKGNDIDHPRNLAKSVTVE